MADSRRVFVQLARAEGAAGVARDPPVMAFVVPTDAWPAVVNEFLMVRASASATLFGALPPNPLTRL